MSTNEHPHTVTSFGEDVLDRMVSAVEKVRERLQRSTRTLEDAGIPYAVIGGNAVAAWVAKVDPGAARNTADVDLMVERADFGAVKTAMEKAGFIHRRLGGVDMFLDGPTGRPRDAVHIVFAREKVHADYPAPAPDLCAAESNDPYRLLGLEPLVTMKLTSFRDKDRTHLRDLIEVGLIGPDWLDRLPPALAGRLQQLLDTPDG
ncbi:MAG: hypothetical protein ACLFU6_14255 [Candidatus Hydrogenedentota bacterium]